MVRFEHHITETQKSIVRQPYDRREELIELADHVANISAKHEGGDPAVDAAHPHPSDILDYFRDKSEVIASGDWDALAGRLHRQAGRHEPHGARPDRARPELRGGPAPAPLSTEPGLTRRDEPRPMTDLVFPPSFLWGTATAAHQVEGGNTDSDWWNWEQRPDTPCVDRSGVAIDHYHRYPDDVAMLAGLGLNAYRYSVEWARIEPEEGAFAQGELDHYRRMTDAVREAGMTPMVTLHHFTLPRWVAARGGWMDPGTPARFARYCETVVRALGDRVDWYCTINEPGVVAFGGYLGALRLPAGHPRRGVVGAGDRRADRRPPARPAGGEGGEAVGEGGRHPLHAGMGRGRGRPPDDGVRPATERGRVPGGVRRRTTSSGSRRTPGSPSGSAPRRRRCSGWPCAAHG